MNARIRYTADAALNLEANPDRQEYQTFSGLMLEEVIRQAEEKSVTGEAYSIYCQQWCPQYRRWEDIEQIIIY